MPLFVMKNFRLGHFRRAGALAVFAAGFMSFMLAADLSFADDSIPVPAKKPSFDLRSPQIKKEVIKYSLDDFSKVLLDFGEPPVPKPRPFVSHDGPMADETIERYKKIFALQAAGDMKAADKEMAALDDLRLRGHVLYQRYMHPTAYTSNFDELRNWLELYADYPKATKIYNLAMRKISADFTGNVKKPKKVRGVARVRDPMMYAGKTYRPGKARNAAEKEQIANLKKSVMSLVYRDAPTKAYEKLQSDARAKLLDSVEVDLLQARIAAGYLYAGKSDSAYTLSVASAQRSGLHVPLSGWIAGLVSWQKGSYKEAAKFFEMAARSPYASGWTAAAGSYWAARSHMRTGNVKAVSIWLKRGMEHPRTFYGLLSTRALGRDFDFNWSVPRFTDEYRQVLEGTSAGRRGMALVAADQPHRAEAELLRINPGKDETMRDALLAYAGHAGLPALGLRLGSAISGPEGTYYDAALYPTGTWKPEKGYKIDPALIHAIMRQESRFDPSAESPSGAVGLMQLMPRTARYVAGSRKAQDLTNPETNLEIGQKYIEDLLDGRYVQGDLMALLVAYNAGPGNLARWKKGSIAQDPLLFIELIPSKETRIYVERVLANYWIYRLREGQPTPTMDAIAAGKIARYADAGYVSPYKVAAKN